MMDRYEHYAVHRLLQDDHKIRRWFQVEAAWLAARFGIEVPELEYYGALAGQSKRFEYENGGHDVLGFVQAVADRWPDERWATHLFHYGLTSSDVVDTAESLLIQELHVLLHELLIELHAELDRLVVQASGYVWTTSHGRRAEPMPAHQVYVVWSRRVVDAGASLAAGALDNREGRFRGPAGSSTRPTTAERVACRRLQLEPAVASFQAMNRETRAQWHHAVAIALSVLDGLAMHLKRWICEERDGFPQIEWQSDGVPSSSMPHKRNPTRLERIHGLSTLFASMQAASLHVVPMWDEREIGHSSADRVLHDAGANWLAFSAQTLLDTLRRCVVVPGLPTSPGSSFRSVHQLIDAGMSRQQATNEVRNQ